MIIIGEKLNSSIPKTFDAMEKNDSEIIRRLAIKQEKAGARYLDVNTALFTSTETEKMKWVLDIVQDCTKCDIMLDSPSPKAIEETIHLIKDRDIIINSVTLNERLNELLPLIKQYKAGVVGLPIDSFGIPANAENRIENSKKLIQICRENNIKDDKIYIDVLAESVAVGERNARTALDTCIALRREFPNVHIICGLSNISFGLPKRNNINTAFLSAAVNAGLDSAILDITNPAIKTSLLSALVIAGQDEYCMNYLDEFR